MTEDKEREETEQRSISGSGTEAAKVDRRIKKVEDAIKTEIKGVGG